MECYSRALCGWGKRGGGIFPLGIELIEYFWMGHSLILIDDSRWLSFSCENGLQPNPPHIRNFSSRANQAS